MIKESINLKEFIKSWLKAWTGNQPDLLLEFYEKNAYYQDPATPKGLKGVEKIRPYFIKLLAKYPSWTWELVELFETERTFIIKWKANILIKGQVKEFIGLDIVEIKNQKIIRNEVYFDTLKLH